MLCVLSSFLDVPCNRLSGQYFTCSVCHSLEKKKVATYPACEIGFVCHSHIIIYHAIYRYFWVSIHQVYSLKKHLSDLSESLKMIYRIFQTVLRRETVILMCPTLTCYLKRFQTASQFKPCMLVCTACEINFK